MSLANMRELMAQARAEQKAVGAFSVSSINMILGVIRAAEALKTPVIIQVAESRLSYSPLHVLGPAMIAAAKYASVPVAVHLDHGLTLATIREALDLGFTSVMIDGSRLPMEENIRLTKQVIITASQTGAAVEAEIGRVGKTESGEEAQAVCTTPEDALYFIEKTRVDALAVAIGNAHGVYIGSPQLRFDVLEAMTGKTDTPLVLHGGTGISPEDFRRCIALGMNKINIATASFQAAAEAARLSKAYFDMAEGVQRAVERVAREHIAVFGATHI